MASLRETKKAATRVALSEAAVDIALNAGLEAATVSAIAKAANVSTRTFHNYFATRDDALLEYLTKSIQTLVGQLADFPTSGDLVDDLETLVITAIDCETEFRPVIAVLTLSFQLDKVDYGIARTNMEEIYDQLLAIFMQRYPKKDAEQLERILFLAEHAIGLALSEHARQGENDPKTVKQRITECLNLVRHGTSSTFA